MRPSNQVARERLDSELRRQVPADAASLAERLGVSLPTMHRMLRERGDQVVRQGTTKNARYALRRSLRGQAKPLPVYSVNADGHGQSSGFLELVAPAGAMLDVRIMGWPCAPDHRGWWEGLPYPLNEMRPQGFLGRNFARRVTRDFNVPENPNDWSDDDIAYVLSLRGADTSGNLIIGDIAYQRWLESVVRPPVNVPENVLPDHYAELAVNATSNGFGGSSAGGEFPKFTACRALAGAATPHVIVKFSADNSSADNSSAVQRWSDLLVCEHLALAVLGSSTKLAAAPSRILHGQGRTFLEVERFDRLGDFGRSPLVSLASLDAAFIGAGNGPWPELAQRLVALSILPDGLVNDVLVLWWYGKLIANTDMHLGNLSFQFDAVPDTRPMLRLSPAYDMLPMLYAPLSGGEVPVRNFELSLPLPREQDAWKVAYQAALAFWNIASQDTRISQPFRDICRGNYEVLDALGDRLPVETLSGRINSIGGNRTI